MSTIDRNALIRAYQRAAESAYNTLGKFKARLEKDPAYAFEWSDNAMEAAAEVEVLGRLMLIATHTDTAEEFRSHVRTEANRRMREGLQSSSTSGCTNIMARATGLIWERYVFSESFSLVSKAEW